MQGFMGVFPVYGAETLLNYHQAHEATHNNPNNLCESFKYLLQGAETFKAKVHYVTHQLHDSYGRGELNHSQSQEPNVQKCVQHASTELHVTSHALNECEGLLYRKNEMFQIYNRPAMTTTGSGGNLSSGGEAQTLLLPHSWRSRMQAERGQRTCHVPLRSKEWC